MPTQVRLGGTWRELQGCKVYAAGAWRTIVAIQVYSGGSWRTVANFTGSGGGSSGGITLSVIPETLSGTGTSGSITTLGAAAAIPSGGRAPYTYSWTVDSTTGTGTPSAVSPAIAVTPLSISGMSVGTTTVVFRCTCTDRLGSTAYDTCTVTFTRTA